VVFLVAAFVLTVVVVVTTKGSFARLGRIHFRSLWLLFLALGIQTALEVIDFPKDRIDDLGFAILLLSYVLILVFYLRNSHTQGMMIIAIGIALNVVVIAANQGMPTADDVVMRHGREVHVPIERTVKHRPQDGDTRLSFLGDVLGLPDDSSRFSVGDVVIGIGIVYLCFEASRRPRRRGVYLT
jgi:hypothetical protein